MPVASHQSVENFLKRAVGITTLVLGACLLLVYIAAKAHFFTRYGVDGYLREHSVIWLIGAGIAFLLWLVSRRGA